MNWSGSGEGPHCIRHGRRLGRRYRVLPGDHTGHRAALPGYEPTRKRFRTGKIAAAGMTTGSSPPLIQERSKDVPYQTVVDRFQEIFHGDGSNGLILREQWVAREGLFDRLAGGHQMAVFTGRLRWEAQVTLSRFLPNVFDPVIGVDDVLRSKPDPEGLLKICSTVPHAKCWYVGDTVDDARASSAANIPFVGIASPSSPGTTNLVRLLRGRRSRRHPRRY